MNQENHTRGMCTCEYIKKTKYKCFMPNCKDSFTINHIIQPHECQIHHTIDMPTICGISPPMKCKKCKLGTYYTTATEVFFDKK
jgi:hypothetical protein